jgi:hypothetical protein
MSVREGIRANLSDQDTLRASLYMAGALGLALLATWPRGPLETALRIGAASETFTVVAVCFLLVVIYLGARWGAEDAASGDAATGAASTGAVTAGAAARLHEYALLTPVSLVSLVLGRFAVGVLHTLVLLLLGAPFLVAAMAVGGAGIPGVFVAVAVIGAASLAARMCGLLALVLLGTRRPLREVFLFIVLAGAFGSTFFFAPALSPFSVLAALLKPAGGLPAATWCLVASLGAAALFAVLALTVLTGVRSRGAGGRRASRTEHPAGERHE